MASIMQNSDLILDVNQSSLVSAADALQVINWLNRHQNSDLSSVWKPNDPYVDTNGDGLATAWDALLVINALDRYSAPLNVIANVSATDDPNLNGVVLRDSVQLVALTLAGVRVDIVSNQATTSMVSDTAGAVHFSVPLTAGSNKLTILATDPLGRTQSVNKTILRGDIVTDWNATVLNVVREWAAYSDDPYEGRIVPSEPPRVAKNLAMIHTAMFDAANAIEGGFEAYLQGITAPNNASLTAAASSAAYHVASSLYPAPDELAYWNATLAESLAMVEEGESKDAGIAFGQQVGDAMLTLRVNDGADSISDYLTSSAPGDWNRTFPNYLPSLLPQWRAVTPFSLNTPEQFRPIAPPILTSDEYADAVDEVMNLGGLDSSSRTADQNEIAVFWADGGGTFTPPGHWNQIAADVVMPRGNSVLENSRVFALLNLALADAGISAWDAKYEYELWRPIDAIRQAEQDGNDQTVQDKDWLPLLLSPPFPTYTSGHSTFSGAADEVLSSLLGNDVTFTSQNDAQSSPGQRPLNSSLIVTRSFDSFAEAAEEAGLSRIYGGIHFNFDNTMGLTSGRNIGQLVVENFLRPTGSQMVQ
tara:strand:- start:5354 stop:7120 length:1767 start_codon:yes stop_codon:yes gene_type:complete